MPFKAGDAFLAQLPDGSTVPHLCLALTDEGGFCSTVFVVPIMTPTLKSDRTTILSTSACPEFLKYDSVVVYNQLVEREADQLELLVLHRYPPISNEILALVIDGVFNSPLTPSGVRQSLKERRQESSEST
jgi:hypothetical protein